MSSIFRVVSLFSGIGGFEEGLKNSKMDFETVFASEIDKYAVQTYGSNFSLKNMHGDIKKINEKDIPDHDLLCAGFPCQSFSVAGKREGFNDIRGTLFFDIVRIIKEKKPKYILLENVKNLVSHNETKTIKTILQNISNCDYTFDFTIINSHEAGVPQSRERTYIFGIYKHKVEPFNNDIRSTKVNEIKKWANINKLNTMNFFNNVKFDNKEKFLIDVIENNVDEKYYLNSDSVKRYISSTKIEDNNINQGKILKIIDLPKEVHNDLDRQRRVYSIHGISPTLLARSDSTKILLKDNNIFRIRKVTPIENFKIQGFDEEFVNNIKKNGVSETQLYKQSGNAVSPPVITGIINSFEELYKNGKI